VREQQQDDHPQFRLRRCGENVLMVETQAVQ
jgi:hypothetical protein